MQAWLSDKLEIMPSCLRGKQSCNRFKRRS